MGVAGSPRITVLGSRAMHDRICAIRSGDRSAQSAARLAPRGRRAADDSATPAPISASITQLDRADSLPDTPAGGRERRERLTVVAVGAGYTGAETVAQLRRWAHLVASRWDRITPTDVR